PRPRHPLPTRRSSDLEADADPILPACRPRRHQLDSCTDEQVAAVRIAETVARAERVLAVAAHRLRTAREPVQIRRHRRRVAVCRAVAEPGGRPQDPARAERPERREPIVDERIFDVAAGQRRREAELVLDARVREYGAVARVVAISQQEVDLVEIRGRETDRADPYGAVVA